jgi:hypothetical protein
MRRQPFCQGAWGNERAEHALKRRFEDTVQLNGIRGHFRSPYVETAEDGPPMIRRTGRPEFDIQAGICARPGGAGCNSYRRACILSHAAAPTGRVCLH